MYKKNYNSNYWYPVIKVLRLFFVWQNYALKTLDVENKLYGKSCNSTNVVKGVCLWTRFPITELLLRLANAAGIGSPLVFLHANT